MYAIVFADIFDDFRRELDSSKIKFYDKDRVEILPADATSNKYVMSDLVDKSSTKADTRMKAHYFAFCSSGQILKCYQVTEVQKYTEAFGDVELGSSATKFVDDFWKIEDNNRFEDYDGNQLKPQGIYWTNTDKSNWDPTASPSVSPTVNSVKYSPTQSGDLNSWFCSYTTDDFDLTRLTDFCILGGGSPYVSSPKLLATEDQQYYWSVGFGDPFSQWSTNSCSNPGGIVVEQTFSNEFYNVTGNVDEEGHGTVESSGAYSVQHGTPYSVEGSRVVLGESMMGYLFDYNAGESGYQLANWQISTDGGTNWTDLEGGATGTITDNTKFQAKTKLAPAKQSLKARYTTKSEAGDQDVIFVPAFEDGKASEYLKDIKFYNAKGDEITDITNAIKATGEDALTMNKLYSDYFSSENSDLVPTQIINNGQPITFYSTVDEFWNFVFDSGSATEGTAVGYKEDFNSWLTNNNCSSLYLTDEGKSWNWDNHDSFCPKLNGVDYGYESTNISQFYYAYSSGDVQILSLRAETVSFSHFEYIAKEEQWCQFIWSLVGSASWSEVKIDKVRAVIISHTF